MPVTTIGNSIMPEQGSASISAQSAAPAAAAAAVRDEAMPAAATAARAALWSHQKGVSSGGQSQ